MENQSSGSDHHNKRIEIKKQFKDLEKSSPASVTAEHQNRTGGHRRHTSKSRTRSRASKKPTGPQKPVDPRKDDSPISFNSYWWLILPILQAAGIAMFLSPKTNLAWGVQFTFLAITALSSYMLFASQQAYSLNKIFWLFNLVFMGLTPAVQHAANFTPWGNDVTDKTMLWANFLILASLGAYIGARHFFKKKITWESISKRAPKITVDERRFKYIGLGIMVACGAVLVLFIGWNNMWLRGDTETAMASSNSTVMLIADKLLRGMMLYISLTAIWLSRHKRLDTTMLVFLLIIALVANFPFSMPRYLAVTFYLALLLASQATILFKKHFLTVLLLVSILVLAPLTNVVRFGSHTNDMEMMNDAEKMRLQSSIVADFDTYSSFCRTIQHVDQYGITWGNQLTGVMLFFIPRIWWEPMGMGVKPVGSGALVYQDRAMHNKSCPLIAEGYINFGILGCLLFAALLGGLLVIYDTFYWQWQKTKKGGTRYMIIFYPIAIGMLLYILRGDLMSSFAYTCGLFISGLLVHLTLAPAVRKKDYRNV